MDAKDKARQIFKEFKEVGNNSEYDNLTDYAAKNCTIICCNNILIALKTNPPMQHDIYYFEKVKQEIENIAI